VSKALTIGLLVCAGLVAVASADDIAPPDWRGQPNSSWGIWEFLDANNIVEASPGHLPFGSPVAHVIPCGPVAGWFNELPGYPVGGVGLVGQFVLSGAGWWDLSGEIDIFAPNDPTPRPKKDIWIQLTWSPQILGNEPFVEILQPEYRWADDAFVETIVWEEFPGQDLGRKVYHSVYRFDLSPNPPWESIKISGDIDVDELIIDTICVPEPATAGLLAIGGLVFLTRRRRTT